MGLLRCFLAFCVIADHLYLFRERMFLSGRLAVEVFFLISGFYMAMILDGKYRGRFKFYWLNRVLRIWPAYLTVLGFVLLTVGLPWLLTGFAAGPVGVYRASGITLRWYEWLYLGVTHVTIIGQEWSPFMNVNKATGALSWAWDNGPGVIPLFFVELIPQAWTLGIEELFYLAAPWYTRLSHAWVAGIFLVGWTTGTVLVWCGSTAMLYGRFFPLCLTIFAGGILSYRIYQAPKAGIFRSRLWIVLLLVLLLAQPFLPMGEWARESLLVFTTVACLPAVFVWSRSRAWDRSLGAYSYPAYLLHFAVMWPLYPLLERWGLRDRLLFKLLALAGVVLGSWAIIRFIEKPLEGLRRRIAHGTGDKVPPAGAGGLPQSGMR